MVYFMTVKMATIVVARSMYQRLLRLMYAVEECFIQPKKIMNAAEIGRC